jgi:hydrogenase maturation factor
VSGLDRERCLTCSDEAVVCEVIAVAGLTAVVRVGLAEEPVAIDLVPDAAPGDLLLCHAGIALDVVPQRGDALQVAQSHEVPGALSAGAGRSAVQATTRRELRR